MLDPIVRSRDVDITARKKERGREDWGPMTDPILVARPIACAIPSLARPVAADTVTSPDCYEQALGSGHGNEAASVTLAVVCGYITCRWGEITALLHAGRLCR